MFQPAVGTHQITNLEHAKLLSDPLRLKLIHAFVNQPKTTKQVALELGESVTKLYRHVDALAGAGLLVLKEERRKRGAVERYYQAVAARFEVASDLFDSAAEGAADATLDALLQGFRQELAEGLQVEIEDPDLDAFAGRFRIQATPEKLKELRRILVAWAQDDAQAEPEDYNGPTYGALLAFYPIADSGSNSHTKDS